MLTVTRVSDDRIDLTIEGKIERPQMAAGLTQLFQLSEDFDNGVMLYTITGFKWPAFDAVMGEALRVPQLFGLIRRFGRIALVADKGWIRRMAVIEGALIPGLEIKAFKASEKDAAEAWLAGDQV